MARAVVAVSVALAGAVATACSIDVRGQETVVREERRFTVDAAATDVVLRTFDGSIEVGSWDRNEVLIEIERRVGNAADAQALEVHSSQEGGRLTVEASNPRRDQRDDVIHIGSWRSPSVSFKVTVPRRLTIEARSGDGAITARDLAGRITLRTSDGSIRTEHLDGVVAVDTGDGAVVARDLRGSLELNTADGAVDVSGRFDALRVNTGDGSVRVDVEDGSAMKSEWTVHSGDGAITMRLPAGFNAELDAHSGDGRITVSDMGTATPSDDDDRPAQLRGRLGAGGQTLRVNTGDGAIVIRR